MKSCNRCKRRICAKKEGVYLLLREEREEVHKFINIQLKKGYMRPLKLPQMVPMFFIRKKNCKKHIVQKYRYLNK